MKASWYVRRCVLKEFWRNRDDGNVLFGQSTLNFESCKLVFNHSWNDTWNNGQDAWLKMNQKPSRRIQLAKEWDNHNTHYVEEGKEGRGWWYLVYIIHNIYQLYVCVITWSCVIVKRPLHWHGFENSLSSHSLCFLLALSSFQFLLHSLSFHPILLA